MTKDTKTQKQINSKNFQFQRRMQRFYVFSREGLCLIYRDFTTPTILATPSLKEIHCKPSADETKLLFGLLFTLKPLCQELSLKTSGPLRTEGFNCMVTAEYVLHHFQALTGFRFVLITQRKAGQVVTKESKNIAQQFIKEVYKTIFVPIIFKNPLLPSPKNLTFQSIQDCEQFSYAFSKLCHKVEI